jgi:hypothetical protein
LFNTGNDFTEIGVTLDQLGIKKRDVNVKDLWNKKEIGPAENEISMELPAHGACLLRLR